MSQTGDLAPALPPQQAALVLARVLEHIHELDAADLPMPSGRPEAIVTVSEVRAWLEGLRARSRAGERL
jgi:hypothetical protein